MHVDLVRHALDRVPLSLIIDDSTLLVTRNSFFMRDRSNPLDPSRTALVDVLRADFDAATQTATVVWPRVLRRAR